MAIRKVANRSLYSVRELRINHHYTIKKAVLCLSAPAKVRELSILKKVTV